MGKFIYTRDGTKCRVIHKDDKKVLAAVQIVHQSLTYAGDDFDEHEDDGPIWELSPSQCFDAPPTMQVSEELVALEKRAHEVRAEIHTLGITLKAAQKAHDEKMTTLKDRHEALAQIENYIDGGITHYVTFNSYGTPNVVASDGDLDEVRHNGQYKKVGRLLTLSPEKIWSGELVWRLNQYRDGSGSDRDVKVCTSYEEVLTHLQAWVDKQAQNGDYNRTVLAFVKKHKLALPDGYTDALISKEQKALLENERDSKEAQRDKRRKAESGWKKLSG